MEAETERVLAHDKLGQGDILSIEYPVGETGPDLGLVINADCDLANGKIDGTIAYLPMFSFSQYVEQFWSPGFLQNTIEDSSRRIVDLTKAGSSGIDDLAILLGSLPEEDAISRLCNLDGVKPKDHQGIADHVHRINICRDATLSSYDRFGRLCRKHKEPRKHAQTLLEGARRGMGDGHFFVSDLVGRSDLGFVIRMRRIYSLPEDCVFTSNSDQRAKSNGNRITGMRFARLTSLYRFRVLQLFSQQFSRIGLPDEITALSSMAVDDLVAKIVEA